MNHTEIQELLDEYVSNELSPSDRDRVEAHLENCIQCQRWMDMIRLQKETLRSVEEDFVQDGRRIPVPNLAAAFAEPIHRRRRFSPARFAGIAAALVLVAGLGVLSLRYVADRGMKADSAAPESAAMDVNVNHAADASHAITAGGAQDDSLAVTVTQDSVDFEENGFDYSSDPMTGSSKDVTDRGLNALQDDAAEDTTAVITSGSDAQIPERNEIQDNAFPEDDTSSQEKDISFSALTDSTAVSLETEDPDLSTVQIATMSAQTEAFFFDRYPWLMPAAVGAIAVVISGAVWLLVKRKY